MAQSVSPEALSQMIGAIYDCALAPTQWEVALGLIREEFGFVAAALGVMPLATEGDAPRLRRTASNIAVGIEARTLDTVLATAGADFVELWGGVSRVLSFPLDEPLVMSRITEPATWPRNAYYRAVTMPLQAFDAVGVCVDRDAASVTHLGFGVHRSLGAVDAERFAALRLLSPHVRRAIAISRLFELKDVEASDFADTIDALSAGVVLVDAGGAVLHANPAALALFRAAEGVGCVAGRIALDDPVAAAALDGAIRAAAEGGASAASGLAVPFRSRRAEPHVVHVLPLGGERRRGCAPRAVAMLFVTPVGGDRPPMAALTQVYGLTAAEARVFELVCKGLTPAEIARLQGVAASTVKTHLLHIFEKTGSRRQSDLIRLGARFSAPA